MFPTPHAQLLKITISLGGLLSGKGFRRKVFGHLKCAGADPADHGGQVYTEPLQRYAAGLMFWFMRKKFVGSYFFFKEASRS